MNGQMKEGMNTCGSGTRVIKTVHHFPRCVGFVILPVSLSFVVIKSLKGSPSVCWLSGGGEAGEISFCPAVESE